MPSYQILGRRTVDWSVYVYADTEANAEKRARTLLNANSDQIAFTDPEDIIIETNLESKDGNS